MPFPRLIGLLEYWSEWPPAAELLRGFVGFKPLSKQERVTRDHTAAKAAERAFGPPVNYEKLPKWLRDIKEKERLAETQKAGKPA